MADETSSLRRPESPTVRAGGSRPPQVRGGWRRSLRPGGRAAARFATPRHKAVPGHDPAQLILAFGPFQLLPSARLLLERGQPVRLGSRAIDLLAVLVTHAGQIVTKEQLRLSVWPSTVVEDSSLRVHVAALRKALGDGSGAARYIANIPGRGYSFVADVTRVVRRSVEQSVRPAAGLPTRLSRLFGLQPAVREITDLLVVHRLVTIVGPGGFGKTTAAIAAAEAVLAGPPCEVRFVNLASSDLPGSTAGALASAVGPKSNVSMVDPAAERAPRDRQSLLVLDGCERLVDDAARCAERWLKATPGLRILATSREALRAEGEAVYRLDALAGPPRESMPLGAKEALRFPATQLLAERIRETTDSFRLSDADAEAAAELCRRLDGMPLAIELAAARVGFFGLRGVLAGLDEGPHILTGGKRTSEPRHRSLHALLDWSFDALDPRAQAVLQRLAGFSGPFTLAAAAGACVDAGLSPQEVVDVVIELASKSMVLAEPGPSGVVYRLLGTTRAYVIEKPTESRELAGPAPTSRDGPHEPAR